MDKVTICDHTFLEHTKSASIGGDNIGVGPTHFEWEYADAQTARFVTDGDIKHAKGKGQVAWLLEPYHLHHENYDIAVYRRNEFDAILSPSFPALNFAKWYPYGGSWISFDEWGMKEKTKDISIIISDKNTMEGHRLRHEVVRRFGPGYLDVFYKFPDKYDAIAPYKYSVVIESVSEPYYFTEKLIDCLCLGTMPIYYGSPNIEEYFNAKGIIQTWSLDDIEIALKQVEDYYDLDAIKENIELCHHYAICEDWIYNHYPELFQ